VSSPAVKLRSRAPGRSLVRAIPREVTLPALTTEAVLAFLLAAALAGVAFGAKGGLTLDRTTTTEIALVLGGALIAAVATLIAPTPRRAWGAVSLSGVAVLAALTAASVIWSVQPSDTWLQANLLLAYLVAFGAAIALARVTPRGSGWVVAAVLMACLAVCVWALLTKVLPDSLNRADIYGRLREPFGYWNAVGLMAALAVPALLWLGTRREGGARVRALAAPMLALMLVTMLLSTSRASLLAAAVGAAFWFVLVPRRIRGAAVLGLAALGAGAVMAWGFQQDGLTKDGVRLATRADAGHLLGVFLVVMIVALFAAALLLDRRVARRPLNPGLRRRVGIALLVAVVLLPVAGVGLLAASQRGLEGSITHAWGEVTDPSAAAGNSPSRLTQAGSVRGKYWNEAWQVFEQAPVLGSGAGTFSTARTHFRTDTVAAHHAHGYAVQELAELGLAGAAASLFALVAWMLAAARAGGARPRVPAALARAIRRRPPPATATGPPAPAPGFRNLPFTPDRIAVLTLIAGVLVFGVHSLVDWTWFVPGTAVVALVGAGYVAGRGPFAEPRGGRVPGTPWRVRLAIAAALVAGALLAAWTIWQPLRSNQAADAALGALSRGNVAAAYVNVTKARHRNPLAVEPLFDQATIEDSVGRRRAAERLLQQAVRLQPGNALTWQRLGEYELSAMQRPRAAVDELRAALFLDPRSPSIQRDFVAATRALATAEQNRRGRQAAPTTPSTPGTVPGATAPTPTPARPPATTPAPSTGGTQPNAAPSK
jgi:hypothetical protein